MIRPAGEMQYLVVVSGAHRCVLPLVDVIEIMRPLPIDAVVQPRAFVRGLSVLRGTAVPVIDLLALLDPSRTSERFGRFVSLGVVDDVSTGGTEVGRRRFALGVDEVRGVATLAEAHITSLDPLLRADERDVVASVVRADAQLHRVLRPVRIVPNDVWRALEAEGAST